MQIKELMSADVQLVQPSTKIADAARMMREQDFGVLPVGEDDQLQGMLTDRDIVVRVVADGKDPGSTAVSEAMSGDIYYCFEEQSSEEVAANMGAKQVRRMPVVNRDKRLVGIVSIGDISTSGSSAKAGEALEDISKSS